MRKLINWLIDYFGIESYSKSELIFRLITGHFDKLPYRQEQENGRRKNEHHKTQDTRTEAIGATEKRYLPAKRQKRS